MQKRKSLRHYVTNVISFANSRTNNKFHDRSFQYFAGYVTPEFQQLMRDIWAPILNDGREIIVIRAVRPKNIKGLGISIEGITVEQLHPQPSVSTSNLCEPDEYRHFVHSVVENSLFGRLNCLIRGDELLQVNGYRLHGRSHVETIKCLRSLPPHIELVVARSYNRSAPEFTVTEDGDFAENTIDIAASEIGSIMTGFVDNEDVDGRERRLVGSQPSEAKVTEWVRQSQLRADPGMRRLKGGYSPPLSLMDTTQSQTTTNGFLTNSASQEQLFPLQLRNYPRNTDDECGSSASSFLHQTHTWSTVPLIFMMKKDDTGFGFSFSEFEKLEISDTSKAGRRVSTVERRRSTIFGDPRNRKRRATSLTRGSSFRRPAAEKSPQPPAKCHTVLLVNGITEGGAAAKDGRLAVGDRLLFINDRKLSRCGLLEGASILQNVPNGYNMLGVSKMSLVNRLESSSSPQLVTVDGRGEDSVTKPVFSPSAPDCTNDHPLDYYSQLIVSEENAHLHASRVSSGTIPEMDRNDETVVRVKMDSSPLGLRLDSTALGGVDGCRVIQVLCGGVIANSGSLRPGDYITRINSESLRNVSNSEAFRILRNASINCRDIEIAYYSADKVAAHRAKFLRAKESDEHLIDSPASLTNGDSAPGSTMGIDHLITTSTLNLSSEVLQSGPWMQTCEVKLLKRPGEQSWGFRVTGPDLWTLPEKDLPLPPEVSQPVFISEVAPESAAARCELLSVGDIIVGVNGMDASSVGCRAVAEWIQESFTLSATSPKCVTSDGESFEAPDYDGSCLYLLVLPLSDAEGKTAAAHYELHNKPKRLIDLQAIPSVQLESMETSMDGQADRPSGFIATNGMLFRPDLVSSNDSIILEEEPSSVATPDQDCDLSVPQPLAFTGLRISPPQVTHSASETEPELTARQIQSLPLHNTLANSASQFSSKQVKTKPSVQSVESQSAWRKIGSPLSTSLASLTENYRRSNSPMDEIHVVTMQLQCSDSFSASAAQNSGHPAVGGDCETLGIRLVGHRATDERGVFICSIREGSIADKTLGLRVTDEIVQVNNVCVVGLTHISAKLMISKETEMVRRRLSESQTGSTDELLGINCLYIVIRRNAAYNASVMAKPVNLSSAQFQLPSTKAISLDAIERSPSPIVASSPINGPVRGISSSSSTSTSRAASASRKLLDVELFDVTISRNKSGFGLCLVNMNPNRELGVFVQSVDPKSPAGQSGLLRSWDRIVAVDGAEIEDYDNAFQILKRCKLRAKLRIARIKESETLESIDENLPPYPQSFSPQNCPTPISRGVETIVEFVKAQGDLGVSIIGGLDSNLGGIFIHEIFDNGLIAQDGRLKVGDRLLAVNNFDLRNVTHAAATQAFRSMGQRVLLTVIRDLPPSPPSKFQHVFTVTLQHTPGQHLGLVVEDSKNAQGVVIASIVAGSPASRNTVLQPGDFLQEIDGLNVQKLSAEEVSALLSQCPGYVLLKTGRPASTQPTPQLDLFTCLLIRGSKSQPAAAAAREEGSQPSTVPNVFGLVLRGATEAELSLAPGHLIIDAILPGSPAERTGMLQVGDRMLGLDREPVDWLTFAELESFTQRCDSVLFEFGRLPPPPTVIAMLSLNRSFNIPPESLFNLSAPCEPGLNTVKEEFSVKSDVPIHQYERSEHPSQGPFSHDLMNGVLNDQPHSEASDVEEENTGTGVQIRQITLPFVQDPPEGKADWLNCSEVPRLGISIAVAKGVSAQQVVAVEPGSPAQISGLLPGDLILGMEDVLLVAFGGKDSVKILNIINKAWLLRTKINAPNNPFSLTIIRNQLKKPSQLSPMPPRRENIDDGFVPRLGRQQLSVGLNAFPRLAPPVPQRKYPKDVGDNIDVNLQAAPPGLLAGLGAGAIVGASASGVWQGSIDDHSGQPFHLPGDRECVVPPDVDDYTPLRHENDEDVINDNYVANNECVDVEQVPPPPSPPLETHQ